MKKRNFTLWLLAILGMFAGVQANAQQNVNMPQNTGQQTFTVTPGNCLFNFFDAGGPGANYLTNANEATSVATFAPTNPGAKIRATFNAFATENSFDALYIRDGATTGDPLISSGAPIGFTNLAGGWQGAVGQAFNIPAGMSFDASAGNASGALTFQFISDGSVTAIGWDADVIEAPVGGFPVCTMTPANVTALQDATTCLADATVPLPTFTPGGCQSQIGLQYSVNGGAPVVVSAPFPASIAVNNLPLGNHTVLWQTFLPACSAVILETATSTISVVATPNAPPVFSLCPQDIIINLAPGECEAIVSYGDVCATDCGGFVLAGGTIGNVNETWTTPFFGQRSFYFNVRNDGTVPISITDFQKYVWNTSAGTFTTNVDIFVTTTANTYVGNTTNAGAWTLVNSGTMQDVMPTNFNPTLNDVHLTTPIDLDPGQQRGVYFRASTGYGGGPMCVQPTTAVISDGTLSVLTGQLQAGSFGGTLFAQIFTFYGSVTYSATSTELCWSDGGPTSGPSSLGLINGLESGSSFPRGTTEVRYRATDSDGNTADCVFNVTVNEYPNPIHSLVCNDLVQVSVDENCTAVIGADQVLEGGPYGCYDDYIVEVDKTAPFGNGPWLPAVFNSSDIGKTYQIRVTDPDTGNKCWGNIKIEDKLPPVLDCPGYSIVCNADPTPGPAQTTLSPPVQLQTITNANNGNAVGGMVWFDIDNISGLDVFLTAIGANITTGSLIDIYIKSGTRVGFETNMAAWTLAGQADATTGPFSGPFPGNGTLTPAPITTGAISLPAGVTGVALHVLTAASNYTNGTGANQTFTDGTLTLNLGSTANTPWGAPFDPRVWNGYVEYQTLMAAPGLPNELEYNVDAFPIGGGCFNVNPGTGTPVLEPCSVAELCYLDTEVAQDCASGFTKTINRKWTATDASGNTATCIQVIDVIRPTLNSLTAPPSYDGIDEPALECGGVYPSPEYLEGIGLQGYPYVFGEPDGCSIGWTYEDAVVEVCDGTYKVRRQWVIIDWCTGNDIEVNQIIKVIDEVGPTFDCPANITVSTDPFTCCATVDLPNFIATDNCSRINSVTAMITTFDPQTNQQLNMYQIGGSLSDFPGNNHWDRDTMVNVGFTPCLPMGNHLVQYTLEDDCGNTTTCTFRVIVRDFTPPVAACDEHTIVGIGVDDPFDCYLPDPAGCQFAGVTWVKAKTFDDGSYDNCGDIRFTIRRMSPYSDCILGLNPINGHPECDPAIDPFPDFPSEFERAISEYDSIKFYCCEVGTSQTVILRVYQLDANGNITVGPDGTPVFNECMIDVEVQDKIKPICTSPPNVSVSCENFDPSLWAYGKPAVYDNCCLDVDQVYQGQCGLSHTANYSLFDTLCNKGTITRTFRAFDCHGFSGQCTQRIFVNYEQDYWLKFPNDVIVTVCDGTGNYGEPEFNGEDCELLGVSFEDEIFTVVPDACYKIERTWTVINWCTYNPNAGCITVPNPSPNATVNHPSNLPGVTVSPAGTPSPWNPTVRSVAPGQSPTNYSTFWDANANCYKYKQIIKIIDGQAPEVQCPASPIEVCDLTGNDPLFWNQSYWYDSTTGSHDLCEAPTDLCITGTDLCSGSNIDFRYLLFLDLDGDGTMETVVSSTNLPGFNNVQYNNAQNPSYTGGTPRAFDGRPVLPNQKYGFALQTTVSGNEKTACLRWNTQQQPTNYVVPQLPHGTHKIKWFVSDGCGNEKVCEYTFEVKDCKSPTVVCINGLSVNIMPTGMITLWDTDFLQYTEDNCTPSNLLKTGIRKSGTGTGFPTNPDGSPQTNVTFTCDELGTQLVELWSIDLAGNADYCETYVIVQDNNDFCNNPSATVAGALKTESSNGLEDATMVLTGNSPALPPAGMFDITDADGNYSLAGIPVLSDYTLTPGKDNDPLNGVSTFDLVLINKHILGLEPLNTPYKMIAADANNSRSITTFDIVELRKLILGIYTELPNNTSWRFVDKSYTFPNQNNPFSTIFPETKQLANLVGSMDDEDFVSVKTGDVNGNAVTSSLMNVDDRTASTMLFDVEDRAVKAGEVFTVNFKAAEKVQGYQFTMNYNNLELVDVVPGADMSIDNFGVFAKEGALTTSWDGKSQAEFGVTFRAKADGTLSQMLGVSSRITKAEAYNAGAERMSVAFRFNGANGSTIAGLGFELYQNTPNPFINKTQIGFYLPEATTATLSIYDESGRVIYTQRGDYSNGYNAVTIDRAVLNTSGVLYYQLETTDNSATKKMIQSK